MTKSYHYLLSLCAGAILPLAFAPFGFWPLSFISLGILFWQWLSKQRSVFWIGYWFGLGLFGVGISWVFISIHRFGYTAIPLAVFITAGFVAFLALFPALNGYLINKLYKQNIAAHKLLIGFPISYVLFEWLRSWIFTGFPWLFVGYSQIDSPLAGFAPIVGVYGVSIITAISAGALVLLVPLPSPPPNQRFWGGRRLGALLILVCTLIGGQWLKGVAWSTTTAQSHTVSLVQGNITPDDKFLMENPLKVVWDTYAIPGFKHADSELIVWPENGLPLPLPYSQEFITIADEVAKSNQQTLILGVPIEIKHTDTNQLQHYNSLIALGLSQGRYDKQHLVPFGEYLPFDKWLRGLINFFDIPMSDFKSGASFQQQPELDLKVRTSAANLSLLPLICYEIAYPQLVRDGLKHYQANAILTISEDGWFGDSFGPHQHLEIARMRALESGRYVIRATTSGISAIIDQHGKIIARSPQFVPHVLTGKFTDFVGLTPWTRCGQWPVLIAGVVALLGSVVFTRRI